MKILILVSSLFYMFSVQSSDVAVAPDVDQAHILREIEGNTQKLATSDKTRSIMSYASFSRGTLDRTAKLVEAALSVSLCGAGLYVLLALYEKAPIAAYMLNGLIKGAIAGLGWGVISGAIVSFYDLVDKDERQERIKALGGLTAILAASGCALYKMSDIMKVMVI